MKTMKDSRGQQFEHKVFDDLLRCSLLVRQNQQQCKRTRVAEAVHIFGRPANLCKACCFDVRLFSHVERFMYSAAVDQSSGCLILYFFAMLAFWIFLWLLKSNINRKHIILIPINLLAKNDVNGKIVGCKCYVVMLCLVALRDHKCVVDWSWHLKRSHKTVALCPTLTENFGKIHCVQQMRVKLLHADSKGQFLKNHQAAPSG